jgi:N-alpha-acetyltransferase 50
MDLTSFMKRGRDERSSAGSWVSLARSPAASPATTPGAAPTEPGVERRGPSGKRRRVSELSAAAAQQTRPPPQVSRAAIDAAADEELRLASGVVLKRCADTADVDAVRTLNAGLLPLRYPDRFYRDILGASPRLCALVWAGSSVVGAISATVEMDRATKSPTGALYIMTLAVVAPQRRTGLGSALLAWVLRVARETPELGHIDRVELHVHAANSDALAFYARAGFEQVGRVERYYPRLVPPHAERLRLSLDAAARTAETHPVASA